MKSLNEVLSEDDPAQTLKALKNPDGNFPFIYQEASRYHKALLKERKEGLPSTILVSGFLELSSYSWESAVHRPSLVIHVHVHVVLYAIKHWTNEEMDRV